MEKKYTKSELIKLMDATIKGTKMKFSEMDDKTFEAWKIHNEQSEKAFDNYTIWGTLMVFFLMIGYPLISVALMFPTALNLLAIICDCHIAEQIKKGKI